MSVLYVTTQGSVLRKNGGKYKVTQKDEELLAVPQAAVDSVVLAGYVQVTTQAVHELLEHGIPLIYVSRSGRFKGILQPGYPKNVFFRLAQYDAQCDAAFAQQTAREVVRSKLVAQRKTVKHWMRRGFLSAGPVTGFDRTVLNACENVAELMRYEAVEARAYFDVLGRALPAEYEWMGRNRQPPRDPVNALLSLSYMMILAEVVSSCYAKGIDSFVGFLHQLEYGRPSLALDVLEPLRAVFADQYVVQALQAETYSLDMFTFSEENGCRLSGDGFRRYVRDFEAFCGEPKAGRLTLQQVIDRLLDELRACVPSRGKLNWVAQVEDAC